MNEKVTAILLTGSPGVGKTTLIRKICAELQESMKVNCQGFYTSEVLNDEGVRIGFDAITLSGERRKLARENPGDNLRRPKIGKYSVFTTDFEKLTLPLLNLKNLKEQQFQILIIDEIGKMELLSKNFENSIHQIVGRIPIIATIPSQTRQFIAIVERLKSSKKSKIFEINKSNRDDIKQEIMCSIKGMLTN